MMRFPKGKVPGQSSSPETSAQHSRVFSSGAYFISRLTGNVIATLLVAMLIFLAYVISTFVTREHQIKHYKKEQKQLRREMDELKDKNLLFERRMVELETELENMEEGR